MTCNQVPNLLGRLSILKQLKVLPTDKPVLDKPLPVDQTFPKVPSDQYYHHVFGLACLEQRQGLKELIESAKSSGKGNQRLGTD